MNLPIIKLFSGIGQKILVAILSRTIYDIFKSILKWTLIIILILICGILIIQMNGLYDIFELISNYIPQIAPYLDKIEMYMNTIKPIG